MKTEEWVMHNISNINDASDLLGRDKDGRINTGSALFYILARLFGRLLDNDPDVVLSEKSIRRRREYIHKLIISIGPQFLNGKILIKENIAELPTDRPIIFAPNHGFLEDAISSILIAEQHAYFVFGSLPQFFNTFNGIASYLNGSILVNRKNKASRQAVIDKAVRALELGANLILYPEGVWNKTANKLTLEYWPGIIKIAKKSNALIVPIVHLLTENEIHSSRLEPFDVKQYSDDKMHEALVDLRTIMNTELWELMEKYARVTRDDFLGEHETMIAASEDIVKKQAETAGKFYDYPIETTADYRAKDIFNFADVFLPIVNSIPIEKRANNEIVATVEAIQREDYQRRF